MNEKMRLTIEQEDTLGEFGQFHVTSQELYWLHQLSLGQLNQKSRDEVFLNLEDSGAEWTWAVAQGILANVYGEDPP